MCQEGCIWFRMVSGGIKRMLDGVRKVSDGCRKV